MRSLPRCQLSSIRLQRQRDPHLNEHRAGQPVRRRRSSPALAQSANPHRDRHTLGPHLPRLRAWALLRRRPAHAAPPSCRRPRNLHRAPNRTPLEGCRYGLSIGRHLPDDIAFAYFGPLHRIGGKPRVLRLVTVQGCPRCNLRTTPDGGSGAAGQWFLPPTHISTTVR